MDSKSISAEQSDTVVLHWSQSTAPDITQNPAEFTHILKGDPLILTVNAIGNPTPTYQWRINSNIISEATFANYTNNSIQLTNEGYYDVIASNSVGTATSLSGYVKVYAEATAILTNSTVFDGERFEMLVDGIDGYNYTVQGTTDFLTWTNLQTGTSDFVFTNWITTNLQFRFFRTFY